MTSPGFDEPAPASQYTPNGWFNGVTMMPLLAAAIGVAIGMGYLLLLTEESLYYFFVTPLFVAVPVFLAIWGVVRLGQCRNPLLGTLIGLVLGLFYYVGYWELSYRANIVAHGPAPVADVARIGGAPGLPGYFVYRCKTSVLQENPWAAKGGRAPNLIEQGFFFVLFSLEAIFVLVLAVEVGRNGARRVYYEEAHQWSSTLDFRFSIAMLATVLKAIEERDWGTIATIPRLPGRGDARNQSLLFRLEYLAGSADAPVYLSLIAINVWSKTIECPGGASLKKPRWGIFYKQIALEKGDRAALARQFPELAVRGS